MFIEESYIINQYMMYMRGQYDCHGKLWTCVTEVDRTLLVDKTPLEILEDSIKSIGFDLRGARAASKWLLGKEQMHPVMVNPILNICVFPTRSPNHESNMWFNPDQIYRTNGSNRKTIVKFHNGQTITVDLQLLAFNSKLQSADQLKRIITKNGSTPIAL